LDKADFFINYDKADHNWAEWIACSWKRHATRPRIQAKAVWPIGDFVLRILSAGQKIEILYNQNRIGRHGARLRIRHLHQLPA